MRRRTLLSLAGLSAAAAVTGADAARHVAAALLDQPDGHLSPTEIPAALARSATTFTAGRYVLAARVATKIGDNALAMTSADRALHIARLLDDPLLGAAAAKRLTARCSSGTTASGIWTGTTRNQDPGRAARQKTTSPDHRSRP